MPDRDDTQQQPSADQPQPEHHEGTLSLSGEGNVLDPEPDESEEK